MVLRFAKPEYEVRLLIKSSVLELSGVEVSTRSSWMVKSRAAWGSILEERGRKEDVIR